MFRCAKSMWHFEIVNIFYSLWNLYKWLNRDANEVNDSMTWTMNILRIIFIWFFRVYIYYAHKLGISIINRYILFRLDAGKNVEVVLRSLRGSRGKRQWSLQKIELDDRFVSSHSIALEYKWINSHRRLL